MPDPQIPEELLPQDYRPNTTASAVELTIPQVIARQSSAIHVYIIFCFAVTIFLSLKASQYNN
jgi:DNA-binding transcriptional regulator PaaX